METGKMGWNKKELQSSLFFFVKIILTTVNEFIGKINIS